MSSQEIVFSGTMYVELTLLANQFWAAMPNNARDDDFHARMGCALDRHAMECLMSIPDAEQQDRWRTEYHNRYRQRQTYPF